MELLEKSLELRPVYNQELYLNLEAAKKAVAGQKNNYNYLIKIYI